MYTLAEYFDLVAFGTGCAESRDGGGSGGMMDVKQRSPPSLFFFFLREAVVSKCRIGGDVQALSTKLFLF